MRKRSIALIVLMTVLIILSAGCSSSSPPGTASSTIGGKTTNLNGGDTAILENNGFRESITVHLNRTSGNIEIDMKNVGNKATTVTGRDFYIIDWGGVRHNLIFTMYVGSGPTYYPGESYHYEYSFDDFEGLTGKALEGKQTFYRTLGDSQASWIVN